MQLHASAKVVAEQLADLTLGGYSWAGQRRPSLFHMKSNRVGYRTRCLNSRRDSFQCACAGELLDSPPPGFDEAVAISKVRLVIQCHEQQQ